MVQSDVITASGLFPPLFELPGKTQDLFKSFFHVLERDFPLDLSGMEAHGGNRYSDLKLVLNVNNGKIRCELTPAVMLNQFRTVTINDLPRIKKFGSLYEVAVKNVFPELTISDRIYRLNTWIKVEGVTDPLQLLEKRGATALALTDEPFRGMTKEYTIRADLKSKKENVSYLLQKSAIPDAHLYIETAVQFVGSESDVERHYAAVLARFESITKELGLNA